MSVLERGINKALQQREVEVEQQIKVYKTKLEEANVRTLETQNSLLEMEEEQNNLINTNKILKQQIERLETDLNDRGFYFICYSYFCHNSVL